MAIPKPLVLMILDGFGLNEEDKGNAVKAANTSNFDELFAKYPTTTLDAAGDAVGLPEGQMGNSEVGHLNLGAGRVVYQDFTRINKSIEDQSFFENEVLLKAIENVKQNNSALHLMGLLSDGGVHSHIEHLYALLELAKKNEVKEVYIHAPLDGRDVPPACAKKYVTALEEKMSELGIGQIATIGGRYYYMDRDHRWERTQKAYDAICLGEGEVATTAIEAIENSYAQDKEDEFVLPTVIVDQQKEPVTTLQNDDSVIFFNFRPDRARQLTRALSDQEFDGFERREHPEVYFVCMTEYDETIDAPIAFPPVEIKNTLGQVLAEHDLKQLRTAETEKYAHVTFFFNGGKEAPNQGESRELIPSPEVATYEMKPEMSAYQVTDKLIEQLEEEDYDVVILNYANPDMVGHTGYFDAVVEALEVVDECLGKVVDKVKELEGAVLITADHGNSDQMIDYETEEPFTAHTNSQVPLIYINQQQTGIELMDGGKLADVAPTMLDLLEIEIPEEMTGNSLIENNKS
ncbi:2,3-bisphosphoglycerate-independent phosphoglycerate mutase [Natroniella sulfidigena]|uniref:2,3-bisphosphoglycerate-independent phosphoglycerate mutase n=1 Tax=Natroniella sulfidigena TaxID=723921 RepID=UPI003D0F4BDF